MYSFFKTISFVGLVASIVIFNATAATPTPLDASPSLSADKIGADGSINVFAPAPDGGVYVGGCFSNINGKRQLKIAKLKANGSLDLSFKTYEGFNDQVDSLAVQKDGRLLVGGRFTLYNFYPCNQIARLNPDGSLDTSFSAGSGLAASGYFTTVNALAVQADGRILIAGSFSGYNETPCNQIVRVNADGSLDTSFNSGTGFDDFVNTVVIQADGRILAGGYFKKYNGATTASIARLNPDGSRDSSFRGAFYGIYGSYNTSDVFSITIQPDGQLIVAGYFIVYHGSKYYSGIARLNADGTTDASFTPLGTGFRASSPFYGDAITTLLQPDGRIVVGGLFQWFDDTSRNAIARLNADGSLDTTFDPGHGFESESYKTNPAVPQALALLPDGRILVGGTFSFFNDIPSLNFACLTATGKPEPTLYGAPPEFVTQPQSLTADAGSSVTFTASATGKPSPHYQWYKGEKLLKGKTGTSLTIDQVRATDADFYTVAAINKNGHAISTEVSLTVTPRP